MTIYQIPFTSGVDPIGTTSQPFGQCVVLRSGVITAVQFSFIVQGAFAIGATLAGYVALSRVTIDSSQVNGPNNGVVAQSAIATQSSDSAGTSAASCAPVSNIIPVAFRVNLGDLVYGIFTELDTGAAAHSKAYGFLQFTVND